MTELTLDIYEISRCTHNYYARELRKIGVTMGQFPFVMRITENDGISQERLSALLMISKSTTAIIVKQLLELGYVSREVDCADRRNFRLHTTKEGLALIPKIRAIIERCHDRMTADLSDIERDMLVRLLNRVRRRTELELSPGKTGVECGDGGDEGNK